MDRITKKEQAQIIDKVVELVKDEVSSDVAMGRLITFCYGMFLGKEISFEDVFIAIRRAILNVTAVLEELKDVELKNNADNE